MIDDWYINNWLRQDLGLSGFSFARYSEKCFIQMYELYMEKQRWCLPEEHQRNSNICHCVFLLKRNIITVAFRHIESNNSSARTFQ